MNALPSLVSSSSSSASEDTSSVSAELDSNIRASLTLPGLANNARTISSRPTIVGHQSRPRISSSNQPQTRNRNQNIHDASNGHNQGAYFHHPNCANKLSTSSECNLSICYSYMLAVISSIMVVVGIYLSLTRFNLNYLYLSLAGLMLVALGSCLYCIGKIQLNRKTRRKLQLSDNDLEAMDARGLAAATAASHILNTRGLVQIGHNNGLNSINTRNMVNQNNGASSDSGTATTDSLLVMINPNNENGPISILSAQKHFNQTPIDSCDSQMTIQQLDHIRSQHTSNQLMDPGEAFGSTNTDNNEVAMSQMSLNMIPQYFSNGPNSLRPNKLCQTTGPEAPSVINLTSDAFGSYDPSNMPADTTENLKIEGKKANQTSITEHILTSSNSDNTTATSSKDLSHIDPTATRPDRTDIDLPNKSMGPLSQSQIVNVNGRQFLILPLSDTNSNIETDGPGSSCVATVSQDSNNNDSELLRSHADSSRIPHIRESPYNRNTTEELINKIKVLNMGDNGHLQNTSHTITDKSTKGSSRTQRVRRESSFSFNHSSLLHDNKYVQDASSKNKFSPRGLKHSRSFNEKFHIHRLVDRSLNEVSLATRSNSNKQRPETNEHQPNCSSFSPLSSQQMSSENQPSTSQVSQPIKLIENSLVSIEKETYPLESVPSIQVQNLKPKEIDDTRNKCENSTSDVTTSIFCNQNHLNNVELLPDQKPMLNQGPGSHDAPDMQPSTSRACSQDVNNSRLKNLQQSDTRNSTSTVHHRTTLIMGLGGEEELIEINDADIDNMSMLPPSYESLMARSDGHP